ncbi:MAG: alpha/beta hydrolase [Caldilineaceae bacterium]
MNYLPGVTSHTLTTPRLRTHYLQAGPVDGIPVVMIHGNLATGRFYEHLLPDAPAGYRFILPDMRGFGDSEPAALDATRGLRDWADDTYALVQALAITAPVHLVGWSTGGAAIAAYAMDRPDAVASLTFIDPVSPYGFGCTKADGSPCYPDYAGSGGGGANPEFVQRLLDQDRSAASPLSIRNVMNSSYWSANHREPAEREDMLVDEVLKSLVGDGGYPGDSTTSANWPGIAPGTQGILNALSGKYCNWSGLVEIDPKPPVLWTHGSADIVVADGSAWEMGTLGQMGLIPGWPGAEVYPSQPMVSQIRTVLERYQAAGGHVQMEIFEGSGHGPHIDAADRWRALFFAFLQQAQ